ncbi:hypothetical protein B0A58_05680 [Flavobacterium branchiophilum NBRC 15030 = ATCC 35035]|uniref:Methyltransferase family protein n=1 Tax=Flavobacterium branchiophilum TaxID=55197 RepID=A0A543G0W8_9FLAO|nr:class I SAM-dependent methyltransferase [Flavobacterium branchiophilum]OXA77446.1 hypothetical protein B0A58_05680 [Flavobacterium branchiophilum NBRC 15030 = ATCC 35035]TQM39717.1 methyltransferase family protein [Flavobacterium branchiophilum]GEM55616.1 methyltransferase [Flavobacterium branchiophilum NBRC 15030 = ATCC 35035]
MNTAYYKEYYDLERSHWWFIAREHILRDFIKKIIKNNNLPNKKLKILNIGCATGKSSIFLSEFGTVTSIEYNEECVAFTNEITNLNIIHGSITSLPFAKSSFDLVCAFDVIEHVLNDNLAVFEMKRVTNPDGIILITVPAFMQLWSHHDVVNQHFRRYRSNEIKLLFEKDNNGKIIFSSYFNCLLFSPIFCIRYFNRIFRFQDTNSDSGSDFSTFKFTILNSLLYRILYFESKFIKNNIRLPFGVSLLFSWKKSK